MSPLDTWPARALRSPYTWSAKRREDDPKLRLALDEEAFPINAAADEGHRYLDSVLNSADAVLDSVLGTGRTRPSPGLY